MKQHKGFFTALCFLFLVSTAYARWYNIGPGGGGGVHRPSISPFNPDVMGVSCDMGGYYITSDGGKNWLMLDMKKLVQFTKFDYKDKQTIYIGSDKVYKSRDYGKTWEVFADNDVFSNGYPLMMAIDPDYPDTMLLLSGDSGSMYTNKLRNIMITYDGGKSWEAAGSGLPRDVELFTEIFFDRNTSQGSRTIYIGTGSGVYKSENNGKSFKLVSKDLPSGRVFKIAGGCDMENQRTVLYVYDEKNVYKTTDGAQTWEKIEETLESTASLNRAHISVSLSNPDIVYVAVYWSGNQDILKSEDGGATWEPIFYQENADCCWITDSIGFQSPYPIREMSISPTDPNIVLFTNDAQPVLTTDGGQTWHQLSSTNKNNNYWAGNGMEVTTCYGVFFDPKNVNKMYIAYTDIGAFKSVDAGKSWKYIGNHTNTFYWIEIDPDNTDRIWGATSAMHDLPQSKMFANKVGVGKVFISKDAGESWDEAAQGLPKKPITCIVLDPASKVNSRTLYATVWDGGVYKSVDGGKNWTAKNNGLTESLNGWRIIRTADGTLYTVVTRKLTGTGGGLYKSIDSGESWSKVNTSLNFPYILDVAVCPSDKNTLYICGFRGNGNEGGVYRSVDAGKTWKRVLNQDYILGLTVDKRDPSLIYATYCNDNDLPKGRGIYVSKNKGGTWENINDMPFINTYRVTLHPNDIEKIYVTTFGGGVFVNKNGIHEETAKAGTTKTKSTQIKKMETCGKLTGPVTIDGNVNDPAWAEVKPIEDFIICAGGEPRDKTSVKIAYDDKYFYVAVTCYESNVGRMSRTFKKEQRDADLWEDDTMELWFDAQIPTGFYKHILVTPNGATLEARHNRDRMNRTINDNSWNPPLTAEAKVLKDRWVAELKIPLSELGIVLTGKKPTIGFNISRDQKSVGEVLTWEYLTKPIGEHQPEKFGKLTFK